MNQRREPRLPIDRPVDVTLFGTPDIHLRAIIRNASGRGLGLVVPQPLPTGTALRIALDDAILLGEVIYCRPEADAWHAGIELEHALCGLADLAAALDAFREETPHDTRQTAAKSLRQ